MCGIATVIKKGNIPASKQLIKSYQNQKDRGEEGFGFISFTGKDITNIKRAEHYKDIAELLTKDLSTGIMFHHRFPTSTPNYKELAHPIRVANKNLKYNYYVIHNGIITNAKDLKIRHQKEGYSYTTECNRTTETLTTRYVLEQFNDSESLAIELAKAIDSGLSGIQDTEGSIAFMVIQTNKDDTKIKAMYYGRNTGNPLLVDNNKDFLRIASEGTGELADTDILYMVDLKSYKISESDFKIGKYFDYSTNDNSYYKRHLTADKWNDDYDDLPSNPARDNTDYSDYGSKDEGFYQDYKEMKKNASGFVWLSGMESESELSILSSRYDYQLQCAIDSHTQDKEWEYRLRLMEIEDMLELCDY